MSGFPLGFPRVLIGFSIGKPSRETLLPPLYGKENTLYMVGFPWLGFSWGVLG